MPLIDDNDTVLTGHQLVTGPAQVDELVHFRDSSTPELQAFVVMDVKEFEMNIH